MTFRLFLKRLVKAPKGCLGDLFETTKNGLGFKKVLQEVLVQSEKLGGQFTSTKDLQKGMIKNSQVFKEVQEKIFEIGDKAFKHLEDEIKERSELIKDEKERHKFLETSQEKILKLQQDSTNDLQDHLNNLVSQDKSLKKIKTSFKNIKDIVDDLGEKIRNPASAVESLLTSLGQIPMYLQKAQKEGKGFGTIIKDIGKSMMGGLKNAASLLFTPTGLLILGIGAAVAAMAGLFKLFTNYWDFLDKKVIPAQAEFTREIGGARAETKGLSSQMQSAGVEMEMLGYSFEEGTAMIRDFAKAANTGLTIPKDVLKTGKELTFVLGMTAEQSGKLVQQFQKQGLGMVHLNEMFKVGAREARAYGLPVNEVLRDIGDAPDILARFGLANRKEFAVSAAKARSYGLTIKEVDAAFGKQMDTFEGSSIAAAKLNTIFGTNINSMKLMMEHDPVKRMELLRKSLINQGKDWEHLSVAERNVITQTLGVDEATAQLTLSSDKERRKLEAKNLERKKQIKIDEDWNRGMGSIKKTLIAWGPLLDKLMREASDFIVKLFGGDSASDTVMSTAKTAENAIGLITKAISDAKGEIDLYREFWAGISQPFDSRSADQLVGLIQKQNKSLQDQEEIKKLMANEDVKNIAQVKLRTQGKTNDQSLELLGRAEKSSAYMVDSMRQIKDLSSELYTSTIQKEIQQINDVTAMLASNNAQQYDIEPDDMSEPIKPKSAAVETKQKTAKKVDKEKVKKVQEEKKKAEKEKNKELGEVIGDAISKRASVNKIEVVVKNSKGMTMMVGEGLVKGGVGGQ